MTRGRHHNTAHLVADTIPNARAQWIATFNRDRADLGPTHATTRAADDIDRHGPQPPERSVVSPRRRPREIPSTEPAWTLPRHQPLSPRRTVLGNRLVPK